MEGPNGDFSRYFVLSVIFNSRFRSYVIDQIKPDWISDPDFRLVYEVIVSMHRKERPITFLSVWTAIRKDTRISEEKATFLSELIEPYTKEENHGVLKPMLDNVITAVEGEVSHTLLSGALYKSADLLDKGDYNKIFKLYRQIENLALFVKPKEVSFWKNIDGIGVRENLVVKRGIPTGLIGTDTNLIKVMWDEMSLRKGIGRGELGIVLGLSGAGKSTVMLNIAAHQILMGYSAAYFTLELPTDYLFTRMTSLMVDIPTMDIVNRSRREEAIEKLKELKEKFPDHGEIKFFQYRAGMLTIEEMARTLAVLAQEGMPVDSLIVDYADLMKTSRQYQNTWEEISRLMIELRDLGSEYECSVLTASQANRAAKDSKSGLVDRFSLAGAFGKVFGADSLFAITVDKVKTAGGEVREIMQLLTDKNRYGKGGGVFQLEWNPSTGRIGSPIPGEAR